MAFIIGKYSKKMKKGLLLYIIIMILFSCQGNREVTEYTLMMDLVMKKDDSIHVYYKSDGTIDFNEKESLWVKVKGQNKNQRVTVQFPENVVPNQIRIDFSKKEEQKEIVLNKTEFSYLGNSFTAKGRDIYTYFRVDDSNTSLDKEFGVLKKKDTVNNKGLSLYPNGYYLAVKLEELKFKK